MKENKISLGYASRAAGSCRIEAGAELVPEICGDTAVSCRLPDGSRAVILSDGMGQGSEAAAESRAAAGLLRRLLKQGVPSARAVQEVNRYLLQKNQEKETFATVDLAIIGQTEGRAKFYKMGAAPSYIIRGSRIRRISRDALPAGILPEIRLAHISARLSAGDIIVMVSDGICDSGCRGNEAEQTGEDRDWMESFLNDLIFRKLGPRQMAEAILEEAEKRYGGQENDDATVAVVIIR